MIEIVKYTKFLNEQGLTAEEGFLLLALETQNTNLDYKVDFGRYVKGNGLRMGHSILIKSLIERGFIRNLGTTEKLKVDNLRVTDKFRVGIMIDIDDAYREAKEMYPVQLQYTDNITRTISTVATFKNLIEDRQSYAQYVLRGNDFSRHKEFMDIMGRAKDDGISFPNGYAKCKWITFCMNWDGFSQTYAIDMPASRMRMIN